jgi:8-oxo-dGTP pyrophosphatase MutT (NUDIX family)
VPHASDVLRLLRAFDPRADIRAVRSLEQTRGLLRASADPFSRTSFDPGHLTASGVVLAPDRGRVLLVFHRRLQRWLQPGGHVEPSDEDLAETARREVLEETGVALDPGTAPRVVGVDVHQIPARADEPPHWHHDVVFRFMAQTDRIAPEWGREVRWCELDRLGDYDADEALSRAVARAVQNV